MPTRPRILSFHRDAVPPEALGRVEGPVGAEHGVLDVVVWLEGP